MKKVNISYSQKIILRKITFIILLAAFLFSSIMIARRAIDSYKTKTLTEELSKIHEKMSDIQTTNSLNGVKTENTIDNTSITSMEKSEQEENEASQINNQIQELKNLNMDIKGWISIDNTPISYPVAQTVDNSFYLEHDVSKNKNNYGTIFIDTRNDIRSQQKIQGQNIILYGHHMKDGSMFGSLENFRDTNFFNTNEMIKLDLFPNSYNFQIFGVFLVNEDFDYRNTMLGTENDVINFLSRLKEKSLQYRDVILSPDDTILTLSTCEYDFDDARLVVMAKLVTDK